VVDPLLDVRNLHVSFRTNAGTAQVINGVDLDIDPGETVALVGETGCGKSVTSKAILGLLGPTAVIPDGEILFKGENLLDLSGAARHATRGDDITMIMQDPMTSLNPVFTVGDQMTDVLKWQGRRRLSVTDWLRDKLRDDDYRQRAVDMLRDVQISDPERVFDSYPVELSGGMRQRVLIAIALLSEPDLLIADEPGTALDVTTESKILALLDDLTSERGTSVLYITHDLGVARKVSSRINVMYAGEIVEQAPTDVLFDTPQHPYTRGLMDSIPQLSSGIGAGIGGEIPDYTAPPAACRFADRCPHAEPTCREVFPYPRRTEPEHTVACHLYDGPPARARFDRLAAEGPVDVGPPPWLGDGEQGSSADAVGVHTDGEEHA
jgi:peptide/nickel transport system ATP-binding protein